MINIKQYQPAYVFAYPEFAEIADQQLKCYWPHFEIDVSKDKQDLLVNMTPAEYHGTVTTLKLFTTYELHVGANYWLDRVMKMFPRPEIQRAAAAFGFVELNSHAPFYAKINEELGLATEEFYNGYINDPILSARMKFIDTVVKSHDDLESLAGFSFIEGAVLYSSFAYLKHFQVNGKNMIVNSCRGFNQSVIDENLHSMTGAALFKILKSESELSSESEQQLHHKINQLAQQVAEHEEQIIHMIFEKGEIAGITKADMITFVHSRVNLCLNQLGYPAIFEVNENPIAEWFYKNITNYTYNDFFSGIGREYQRDWDETKFVWSEGY